MEVEEYKFLKYYEMLTIIENKSYLAIQGWPIVIIYSKQCTASFLEQFLDAVYPVISKIVVQKGDVFYKVCDKYKKECIEPFKYFEDLTTNKGINISSVISAITQSYANK